MNLAESDYCLTSGKSQRGRPLSLLLIQVLRSHTLQLFGQSAQTIHLTGVGALGEDGAIGMSRLR